MYTQGRVTQPVLEFSVLVIARFLDSVRVYGGLKGMWFLGQLDTGGIRMDHWKFTTTVIVLAHQCSAFRPIITCSLPNNILPLALIKSLYCTDLGGGW